MTFSLGFLLNSRFHFPLIISIARLFSFFFFPFFWGGGGGVGGGGVMTEMRTGGRRVVRQTASIFGMPTAVTRPVERVFL